MSCITVSSWATRSVTIIHRMRPVIKIWTIASMHMVYW